MLCYNNIKKYLQQVKTKSFLSSKKCYREILKLNFFNIVIKLTYKYTKYMLTKENLYSSIASVKFTICF